MTPTGKITEWVQTHIACQGSDLVHSVTLDALLGESVVAGWSVDEVVAAYLVSVEACQTVSERVMAALVIPLDSVATLATEIPDVTALDRHELEPPHRGTVRIFVYLAVV